MCNLNNKKKNLYIFYTKLFFIGARIIDPNLNLLPKLNYSNTKNQRSVD